MQLGKSSNTCLSSSQASTLGGGGDGDGGGVPPLGDGGGYGVQPSGSVDVVGLSKSDVVSGAMQLPGVPSARQSPVGVGSDRLFSLFLAASLRVYVGVVVLVVCATQWRARRDIADLAAGGGGGGGARAGNEMVANEIVHDAIARPPARCFEGDACVVCVEALADASATDVDEAKKEELAAVWLPCGHGFPKACITEWLKRRTLCPTCRQDPRASSFERVAI